MTIPVKIHYNLCSAVVDALEQIFGPDGMYADKVLENVLRSDPRRGARDRAFIAENTYEIVRHARLLATLTGQEISPATNWWKVLEAKLTLSLDEPLPDFQEWSRMDRTALSSRLAALQAQRAVRESVPDWLDELGQNELGERWEPTLVALNTTAPVALRVNALKMDIAAAQKFLREEGIETERNGSAGLLLLRRGNVFSSRAFRSGGVEVQDLSSQLVAPFLEVAPGMCVVDACAGAGGKTLHLAALMANKGRLIALDTEAWKLDELRKRARRAGAHCIETRIITSTKVIKRLHGSADRLLLDVPCSGLGVLRRNPDTKWKLRPEQVEHLRHTQREILERYTAILRPGGLFVYATCSVLPSENEEQLQRFMSAHSDGFRLIRQQTVMPGENRGDGFYMALVEKL